MGQVTEYSKEHPITKKERRLAITRIKKFIAEFAAKPEHAISLNSWVAHPGPNELAILQEKLPEGVVHCGTVGCVGGYASHSPLMEVFLEKLNVKGCADLNYYRANNGNDKPVDILNMFFGVTDDEAKLRHLFAGKMCPSKSDKVEGLSRLTRLLKFHQKQLEA